MIPLELAVSGGVATRIVVPSGANSLVSSSIVGTQIPDGLDPMGQAYCTHEARAFISATSRQFSEIQGGFSTGLLGKIGEHPIIPVETGRSLFVSTEDSAVIMLYFDQIGS
jgi:hypothetical protein